MGKMSKTKGKTGEREVARILREHGFDTKRGVQYHGGPDSPDVVGLPGIHIEVKRCEKLSLYEAMAQAKGDCCTNKPIVVHRRNNCEWLVIQPLEDWIELYKEFDVHVDEAESS